MIEFLPLQFKSPFHLFILEESEQKAYLGGIILLLFIRGVSYTPKKIFPRRRFSAELFSILGRFNV